MKKLIVLLLCFAFALCLVGCGKTPDETVADKPATEEVSSKDDTSSEEEEEEYTVDFDSWQMTLVNKNDLLTDEDQPTATAKIKSEYAGYADARFDARAIGHLHYMCKAAADDGIALSVISGFVSENEQLSVFNAKVNEVMDSDISLTLKQAEDIAKTLVDFPRTNEHELGLAVDFNLAKESFKDTEAYAWLMENAAEYGFILRYPEGKEDQTGVSFKPWHFRYVGIENAKLIKESGLCLEEYMAMISE